MKVTFISTPSHGYLKVNRNFFLGSGFDPNNISTYSGMSKNFVYLEEDCDAGKFIRYMKEQNGIELEFEEKFQSGCTSHNYVPSMV